MLRRPRLVRRFLALVRADPAGVRAGFVAHLLAMAAGLVAGLTLGAINHTLELLPGLLVLVPAAVGLRGNVFGGLGSRLGTLVATGTYRLSRRRDTIVGQNLWAATALSFALSMLLAVVAKGATAAFGVVDAISIGDFLVIGVVGAVIPTVVVMAITIGMASVGVRRGWDVDNVAAPVVTAAGDMVTLPSLFLAALLVEHASPDLVHALAVVSAAVGVAALLGALRSRLPLLRRIVVESVPVLLAAGSLSILAGQTIQSQLEPLVTWPALFIVIPPLLSLSGSLAGILASRVATKLHLGVLDARRLSVRPIAEDLALVFVIAVPIFLVLGVAADGLAALTGLASPGVLDIIEVMLLAGLLATTLTVVVAFYVGFLTYRVGLDPDNHGIPLVSSASDFLGAISIMLALAILGIS